MLRRVAVVGLIVLAGACSSGTTPPKTFTDIDPAVSGPLSATLATQAQALNGQSALAAQAASLALQAGVQANPVTLTASELAAPLPVAASQAPSRSSALGSGGSALVFGFQLTVLNSPQAPSTQTFSGVLLFQDAADAALGAGPPSGGAIPPGVGFILTGGTALWEATAGQESATLSPGTAGADCLATLDAALNQILNGASSYVTACNLATFTNVALAITASTPFAGSATGSQQAALPTQSATQSVPGATVTVDCSQPAASTICAKLTSVRVNVSPSTATVQTGATKQFTATVTGSSNQNVTWSVQSGGAGGTITSGGLYAAPATVGSGTDTIVATSQADPLESGTATVTVSTTPVISVTVSPLSVTVQTSAMQQFTATVTGSSNQNVTWSVQAGGAGGTITSSGLYTAPASAGTDTVVATSVADTSANGAATVTVSSTGPTITVSVQPYAVTVAPNAVQQFQATVNGTSNQNVTWSVTGAPASGTITSGGLYTAPMTGGTYVVVATSVVDTSAYGTAEVTVPSSGFVGDWYGPFSLAEGGTTLTSTEYEVVITAGPAGSEALSVSLICVAPDLVPVTMTSATTFTIGAFSCPLANQSPCTTASFNFASGTGTLAGAELSMTFAGTIDGLSGTSCTTVTDFSGTFGPAINEAGY